MDFTIRSARLTVFIIVGTINLATTSWAQVNHSSTAKNGATTLRSSSAASRGEDRSETAESAPATINLLEGVRSGKLAVDARGTGDGRMVLEVTNRSRRTLRVVLPPGLIASGVTGQFGGMGGNNMGGNMGGNNMMGGNMGGNNMGGNNMGNSANSGGSSSSQLVMPATAGMVMIGQLIMRIVEVGTWDTQSLTASMSGMGGMGGMGGGMGGMGAAGGAGAGFRSLPPSAPPSAVLKPNKTRRLPTPLVSLGGPEPDGHVATPAVGERLRLAEIGQVNSDTWTQTTLRRLAEDQAPTNVAQLALLHVSGGFSWETVDRLAQEWSNPEERTLARRFVAALRETNGSQEADLATAPLFWEMTELADENKTLAAELRTQLKGKAILGLTTREGIPTRPDGPALAVRIRLEDHKATVRLSSTDGEASSWLDLAEFKLKLLGRNHKPRTAVEVADALAKATLGQLVSVRLIPGSKSSGSAAYRVRVENRSPLILNSLALSGSDDSAEAPVANLPGMSLTPRRSVTVPASAALVERLKLKSGIRAVAANLGLL